MFGSHLSVAGGLVNALAEAESLKLDTVQIFTKNQRQWVVPPLDPGAAREWLAELSRLGWTRRTVSHDSYLINLASPDDALWERSIRAMRDEIERAATLSIPFLVSHPGAHMIKEGPLPPEGRIDSGLRRIASAYKRLLRETRGCAVTVCLENTAGGGTTLGRTFDELATLRRYILDEAGGDAELLPVRATTGAVDRSEVQSTSLATAGARIAFCLDSCHALAAGYDFAATDHGRKRSRAAAEAAARAVLGEFDRVCGLKNLRVLHLNDSLGTRGSRIDRHAHIGRGHVALGAFAAIVNHPVLADVPKILETPKEDNARGVPMDTINLRKLRSLMPKPQRPRPVPADETTMSPPPARPGPRLPAAKV